MAIFSSVASRTQVRGFRVNHIAPVSAGSDPSRVVGSYGGHDPQALGRGPWIRLGDLD